MCLAQVIVALTAACGLLLVRTVFGLLSVDHHKYSNRPDPLYTLEVLPELLALYIVAFPGFLPAVGQDADPELAQVNSVPSGTASMPFQQAP